MTIYFYQAPFITHFNLTLKSIILLLLLPFPELDAKRNIYSKRTSEIWRLSSSSFSFLPSRSPELFSLLSRSEFNNTFHIVLFYFSADFVKVVGTILVMQPQPPWRRREGREGKGRSTKEVISHYFCSSARSHTNSPTTTATSLPRLTREYLFLDPRIIRCLDGASMIGSVLTVPELFHISCLLLLNKDTSRDGFASTRVPALIFALAPLKHSYL